MRVFIGSLFGFFFTFFSLAAIAQSPETPSPEKIYVTAEEMPEFAGGQDSLMAFIGRHIIYPQEALAQNQQGVAIISFVVNSAGKITQPQVLKSAAPPLDAEAIRVINSLPPWKPGRQNGQPVAVRFTLPIRFQFAAEAKPQTVVLSDTTELLPGDKQPKYPGGLPAMMAFLAKNIKYPTEALENKVEGMTVISFVVNHRGFLGDYRILKPLGYGTDQEAIRVLQTMPKWIPGKRNGQPVKVKFTLPVRFSLYR